MANPTRIPELGARGGGWVVAQVVLIVAIAASALVGLGWPDGWDTLASVVGGVLIGLGLVLLVAGAAQLGRALTPFPAPRDAGLLVAHGLYRHARHPMYGGGILIASGWSIVFGTILGGVLTLLLALVLELKSRREEAWLVEHYPGYADYRRATKRRFLPYVY